MYAHIRIRRMDLISPDLIMPVTETYLIMQSYNNASWSFITNSIFYIVTRAIFPIMWKTYY